MYNIYSVDEKILFDTDKASIKPGAAAALNQITGSIGQRFRAGQVRVMGFADSRGAKDYDKELSEKHAEAVKIHLVANSKIDASRVSVGPMSEAMSAASNAAAAGRQENCRVEIAVRTNYIVTKPFGLSQKSPRPIAQGIFQLLRYCLLFEPDSNMNIAYCH